MSESTLLMWIVALVAGIAGSMALVLDERRAILGMLGIEYACLTFFAALSLPLRVALVKLVAGVMVCVCLALSRPWKHQAPGAGRSSVVPSGHVFRVIGVLVVLISAWGATRVGWRPVPGMMVASSLAAVALLGLGLLQLGISEEPFRVGVGLLTCLAGFEIAYSAVEPSLAVNALLAAVPLCLAVVISYLLVAFPAGTKGPMREA